MFIDHLEKDDIDSFQTLYEEVLKEIDAKELSTTNYTEFLEAVAEHKETERLSDAKLEKFEKRLRKHLGINGTTPE